MNKLPFKLQKPKFINKTTILISLGILVFCLITVFGIVRSVQAERQQAVQAAVAAEKKKHEAQAVTNRIAALEASLKATQVENEQICSWVKAIAPKYRITVPPLCQPR